MPDHAMQSSHMGISSKLRFALICAGTLCLGFTLVFLGSRTVGYWAYSAVIMEPFTNAVFSRRFEAQTIESIPTVHWLRVTPGFTNRQAAMVWSTNKVLGAGSPKSAHIRIMVLGSSPQEARSAADAAAAQLCAVVQRGWREGVCRRAGEAHRPMAAALRVEVASGALLER